MMLAMKVTEEGEWKRTRLIAYEVWRKGGKNPSPIESYLPIGGTEIKRTEKTKDELDEIWEKYGKLKN
jgi:hypothetical protein